MGLKRCFLEGGGKARNVAHGTVELCVARVSAATVVRDPWARRLLLFFGFKAFLDRGRTDESPSGKMESPKANVP